MKPLFQTKKQLREKILSLESELSTEKMRTRTSALVDSAKLPKCKGLFCHSCIYACYAYGNLGEQKILLGCGKNAGCDDFTPGEIGKRSKGFPNSQ